MVDSSTLAGVPFLPGPPCCSTLSPLPISNPPQNYSPSSVVFLVQQSVDIVPTLTGRRIHSFVRSSVRSLLFFLASRSIRYWQDPWDSCLSCTTWHSAKANTRFVPSRRPRRGSTNPHSPESTVLDYFGRDYPRVSCSSPPSRLGIGSPSHRIAFQQSGP